MGVMRWRGRKHHLQTGHTRAQLTQRAAEHPEPTEQMSLLQLRSEEEAATSRAQPVYLVYHVYPGRH